MSNCLMPEAAAAHHQIDASVGHRERIAAEFHQLLMSLPWVDQRTRQLHKDIQQRKNKAAETLGSMFAAALVKKEESKLRAFAHFIGALCTDARKLCRSFHLLFPVETREEGELNNVQVLIAQGDRSPQTLRRFIDELDQSIGVHTEMKEWAINELFLVHGGSE